MRWLVLGLVLWCVITQGQEQEIINVILIQSDPSNIQTIVDQLNERLPNSDFLPPIGDGGILPSDSAEFGIAGDKVIPLGNLCSNLAIALSTKGPEEAKGVLNGIINEVFNRQDIHLTLASDGHKTMGTGGNYFSSIDKALTQIERTQDNQHSGANVITAVIDTGVGTSEEPGIQLHQDSRNLVDFNGATFDKAQYHEYHGTVIANIAKAVAPDTDILSITACDAPHEGGSPNCYTDKVIIGMCYAAHIAQQEEKSLVINLSMSGELEPWGAVWQTLNVLLNDSRLRTVVVTSSGNSQANMETSSGGCSQPSNLAPAAFNLNLTNSQDNGLIVVAASDNSCSGDFIDVAAPGAVAFQNANYSGSSFAAPFVSGTAALALSANQNLATIEVEKCIKRTANISGLNQDLVGAGLVQADAAVACRLQD